MGLGWGMEILVFTTYRATEQKWYRNVERCPNGIVTSLLGRIINKICKTLNKKEKGILKRKDVGMDDQQPRACPDKGQFKPKWEGVKVSDATESYCHQGSNEVTFPLGYMCPGPGPPVDEVSGPVELQKALDNAVKEGLPFQQQPVIDLIAKKYKNRRL